MNDRDCNFYLFATEQVTCFWMQKSKQWLGFFDPLFICWN